MWNDTDTPMAYLISFRCYGTWLHGDERFSMDRHNNQFGTPKYGKMEHWNEISTDRLKHPPVTLNIHRRVSVEKAIRETCGKRGWLLSAINVRTNHVHTVTMIAGKNPAIALNAFKANATRQMREDGCWSHQWTPWADKGSERWLWTEKHLADAVAYVVNGQGYDLPTFE